MAWTPSLAVLVTLAAVAAPISVHAQKRITIVTEPYAEPSPAPVNTDVIFHVSATDTGDASITYSWDFGDGSERTPFDADSGAIHRYAKPGRYSVIIRMEAGGARIAQSFFLLVHSPVSDPRPAASSTILLDAKRGRVWTVNPDNNSVACIDALKLERLFEAPVGAHPRTLAQAPDGSIWVANQDDATVSILDPETGSLRRTAALPYGSMPFGIVFSPDGKDAFVSLQGTGRLLKLDPVEGKVRSEAVLPGNPRGLAVTGDSKRVLATRFISPADHGEVWDVDAGGMTVTPGITLEADKTPDAENAGRGVPNYLSSVVIAPEGAQAWLPAKKDNTGRGLFRDGRPLDFQSTVRAMVMRVDLAAGKEALPLRLDMDDSEMPSAVAFGPLGDPVFIAFQGSNKVAVWDPNANVRLMTLPSTGLAPQGLAVDGATGRLFVQGFMSRTVTVFDVANLLSGRENTATQIKVVGTVEQENLPERVLRGKRIFYDAGDPRMSKDGYLSCASCHLDGSSDGRVWDFTDRGEGLRKTVSLLGRGGMSQGPVHWSANFDEIQDFEHDIRGPFGGTGFMKDDVFAAQGRDRALGGTKAGLSPELDDLAAYVSSLKRVNASPYRNQDGSMTAEGREGERIFNREDVGCARCHAPPGFTDSRLTGVGVGANASAPGDFLTAEGFRLHDVGTLKPSSGRRIDATLPGLDTPTLKGIWETPPYLHDGSAATLEEVLTTANPEDKHGRTSHLTAAERSGLIAFLRQLDDGASGTGIPPRTIQGTSLRFSVSPLPGAAGFRLSLEWPAAKGFPRLAVHDPSGKTVLVWPEASLRAAASRPGLLSMVWNGRNGAGRAAPGLYYVQACLNGDCRSGKLMFIY